jgi:hypothetical protein
MNPVTLSLPGSPAPTQMTTDEKNKLPSTLRKAHLNHIKVTELAKKGEKLPKGTLLRAAFSPDVSLPIPQDRLDKINEPSDLFLDKRPFWCYGWINLHRSIVLPE